MASLSFLSTCVLNKKHCLLPAWTTSTVLSRPVIPVLAGIVLLSTKIHFAIMPLIATYFATKCYLFCWHNVCCQQVPIMPVFMLAD